MVRFTPTERRTLTLAVGLLALATAGRLLLAPGRADFAWSPSSAPRVAESVGATRAAVDDTLARAVEAARPLAPGETIDVNRAGAVQLQRLPGVGPARAAAIVRERDTGGPFASAADLERVPGIGPKMTERWDGIVEAGGISRHARPQRSARIDLNRALPKELEQITGIGPELARRIVDARTRRGRFDSIEDLLDVSGIGPKKLETMREQAFVR
ncbi:MAG: ComEA family DNA-binding protein [Gemmatimonadota bacterium]